MVEKIVKMRFVVEPQLVEDALTISPLGKKDSRPTTANTHPKSRLSRPSTGLKFRASSAKTEISIQPQKAEDESEAMNGRPTTARIALTSQSASKRNTRSAPPRWHTLTQEQINEYPHIVRPISAFVARSAGVSIDSRPPIVTRHNCKATIFPRKQRRLDAVAELEKEIINIAAVNELITVSYY
jgi:hypothetical protein